VIGQEIITNTGLTIPAKRDVLNCLQLHNNCQEQCPLYLTEPDKGCPEGLVCCVLV